MNPGATVQTPARKPRQTGHTSTLASLHLAKKVYRVGPSRRDTASPVPAPHPVCQIHLDSLLPHSTISAPFASLLFTFHSLNAAHACLRITTMPSSGLIPQPQLGAMPADSNPSSALPSNPEGFREHGRVSVLLVPHRFPLTSLVSWCSLP